MLVVILQTMVRTLIVTAIGDVGRSFVQFDSETEASRQVYEMIVIYFVEKGELGNWETKLKWEVDA